MKTNKRARAAATVFRKPHSGEAVSRDIPSLNPDLGQGQGQSGQSIAAGAQAAVTNQARASIDLTLLEDFQAEVEQDENGEIPEVAENTAVLHHLVKLTALQARVQIKQQKSLEAILTAVEKLATKSGQASHVPFHEAPESSSHTGRQGTLVVQPQNDSACPSWFSGFMQLNQRATQNLDDKLTTSKQDTTLAVVQGMQKSQGIVTKVGRSHTNMGGLYKKARRWRVEERHRFYSNQLYPNDSDSGLGYREQFQQVLGQLDECLEEAGIHRGHVTEVRVHMLNLEKGQKHVSQVFDNWTDGLPDFGPMLKFTSGKTGHEDVKLLLEASALVPPEAQHLHGGPPIVTSKPMEIDNK